MGNFNSTPDSPINNKVVVPSGSFIQRSWIKKVKNFDPPGDCLQEDLIDLESLFFKNTGSYNNVYTLIVSCLWNKYWSLGWKHSRPSFNMMSNIFNKFSYSSSSNENLNPNQPSYGMFSIDKVIKIINKKGFYLDGSSYTHPISIKNQVLKATNYSPKWKIVDSLLSQGSLIMGVVSLDDKELKELLFPHKNKYSMVISDNDETLDDCICIGGINKKTRELKIKFWWYPEWLWVEWDNIQHPLKEVWSFTIKENIH